jgi:PAS domain-containing protein
VQDQSEPNRSEERLRASELRYRRLFETAKDGILILDAKTGKITDANPFFINLFGYSHDELTGHPRITDELRIETMTVEPIPRHAVIVTAVE